MNLPGLLTLLALGLALGWLLLIIHTIWMLTHPPRRSYAWAVARSLPGAPDELPDPGIHFDQWTFRWRTLDLPAWDIRGQSPDATAPVIILTHGWGDSRVTMLSSGRVQALLPHCSRLILWDLPGHGDAPGRCTLGEHESAALRALIEHLSASSLPRVILFGFSLGAITSLRAAADNPLVSAIIAEAPYAAPWTPARNVLRLRALPHRTNLPPAITLIGAALGQRLRWWPRSKPPQRWLPLDRITQPTLILHGELDAISPIVDGETIARQIGGATMTRVPTGEHHNLWSTPIRSQLCTAAVLENMGAATESPSTSP